MQCPRCGNATQQGPNGSWICPNCSWGSGFVPTDEIVASAQSPAVQWLEAQPTTAFNDAGRVRFELFDDDGDFRGGNVRGLYSVKQDHPPMSPRTYCGWCCIAEGDGSLMVVG